MDGLGFKFGMRERKAHTGTRREIARMMLAVI